MIFDLNSKRLRTLPMTSSQPVLDRFKRTYRQLHQMGPSELCQLYANDIVYRNPAAAIRGLVRLEDYVAELSSNLNHCRCEFLDQSGNNSNLYLKWMLHFRHAKLGNRLITLRGASHLQIEEKITFQEDLFDMSAILSDQLAFLGHLNRLFKLRLAS